MESSETTEIQHVDAPDGGSPAQPSSVEGLRDEVEHAAAGVLGEGAEEDLDGLNQQLERLSALLNHDDQTLADQGVNLLYGLAEGCTSPAAQAKIQEFLKGELEGWSLLRGKELDPPDDSDKTSFTFLQLLVFGAEWKPHLEWLPFVGPVRELGLYCPSDTLPDSACRGLALLPGLEVLTLVFACSGRDFSGLRHLDKLKKLHFGGALSNDADLEWFRELTELEELTFEQTRLSVLPEALTQLPRLKVLKLDKNPLSAEVLSVVARIQSLRELSLKDCGLSSLPEAFSNLNLESLNLSRNPDLPPELVVERLSGMESLTTLVWSSSGIKQLPEKLGEMTHLHTLDLVDNALTSEDLKIVARLTALRRLSLGYNGNLKHLPEEMENLVHLEDLHLNGTGLQSEELHLVAQLTSLRRLSLLENGIERLPEEMANLVHLERLILGWNALQNQALQVVARLTALRELSLEHNDGLGRWPEEMATLVHLEYLDLDNTGLRNEDLRIVARLTRLRSLSLAGNRIAQLPEEMENLVHLEYLIFDEPPPAAGGGM